MDFDICINLYDIAFDNLALTVYGLRLMFKSSVVCMDFREAECWRRKTGLMPLSGHKS